MKKIAAILVSLILIQAGIVSGQKGIERAAPISPEAVTVAVTPETEVLGTIWSKGYMNSFPGSTITVVPASEQSSADIMLYSGTSAAAPGAEAGWMMIVARDVIVAVTSAENPLIDAIAAKGISPEAFGHILSCNGSTTWGEVLGSGNRSLVAIRSICDQNAINNLSSFAGVDQAHVTLPPLAENESLTGILKSNPNAILFCSLADITAEGGNAFISGVRLLPVDINSNGAADHFEQFYGDYNSFNRGVYIGKYPRELCNSIYCATSTKSPSASIAGFINWILADGQEYIAGEGLTALAGGEGMIRREMLAPETLLISRGGEKRAGINAWLWIAAVIATVSLLSFLLYRLTRSVTGGYITEEDSLFSGFSPRSLKTPAGLLYDKRHTWVFMEKNGSLTVGIDDFLQHVTGQITRVTMRPAGEKVRKGEKVAAVIQNGKQLDILSPVSGSIVESNNDLLSESGLLNSSPYEAGWICKIEPDNWMNESRLLSAATKYAEHLKDEFSMIKDFLATLAGNNELSLAHVVLQDGGEMKEGVLEEFGPEVWEEFQIRFINKA